jgi:hypothetical protein
MPLLDLNHNRPYPTAGQSAKRRDKDALSLDQLEAFLYEIRDEPRWRFEADRYCEYYDGNQLDAKILQEMEDRGIPPLSRNLIGPTVDLVLGMEAKNQRDWIVIGETEDDTDMANALTVKLREAERVAEADRACSEAYASQVKAGIGWVEVQREVDPFKGDYLVQSVHRREMFWDWRARNPDLSDARYLVRRKWHDADLLMEVFPEHKTLLERVIGGWAGWDPGYFTESALDLGRAFEEETRTSLEEIEWRDSFRRRLCLYEVWYKRFVRGRIMRLPGGRVLEFDKHNKQHQLAVQLGMTQPEPALLTKVRLSWWVGPHQLADIPSPYAHNRFPYMPFWGYREDRTGVPYGLVRRMMSPQDEVNARLSKMMWLLSAKRVIMDADATQGTMTLQDVINEAGRPDAVLVLNPDRRNKEANAFRVESDREMSVQQFNVLKDAETAIQDSSGVYQAMLGKESAAESGVAIANLVEQGATTLAEMNDNYRHARRQVGELLLSLVREDIAAGGEMKVEVEQYGKRRPVILNEMKADENGFRYRSNDIVRAKLRVALEDMPSSPSYRQHVLQQLTELTQSLPADLQALIIDIVVRATDLPQREEIAQRIQQATGQADPDKMDPEQLQAMQQRQAEQQHAQQVEMAEKEAKVRESEAKAEKALAEAQRILSEIERLSQEMRHKEDDHAIELDTEMERFANELLAPPGTEPAQPSSRQP